jgi:4-hydroxy-tetrahydrodipicolinate reductase
MTKIALIGYGKMGKMIQDIAASLPVEIVSIIDPLLAGCEQTISNETLRDADVCIDFTHPSVVMDNIKAVCACHRNLVVGTTGWTEHLTEVKGIVTGSGIGFLYGANMSVGMNIFYEIVRKAAALFSAYPEYDPYGLELHHNQKADSPSGTAKELANILVNNHAAKTTTQFDRVNRKIQSDELHFASIRAGYIPGTHTVGFDSSADTIELTHRVRNRTGFALGALKSAMWLKGKTGMYTIEDYIKTASNPGAQTQA